jgi:hypothetical protein
MSKYLRELPNEEKNTILEMYSKFGIKEQAAPQPAKTTTEKPKNNPTQGTPACLANKNPSWDGTANVWWVKLPDGGFWSFGSNGVYRKEGSKNHGFYKCNGGNIEYLNSNEDFVKKIQTMLQSKGFYIGQNGANGQMTPDTLISIMTIIENPQNPTPEKTQKPATPPPSLKQQTPPPTGTSPNK